MGDDVKALSDLVERLGKRDFRLLVEYVLESTTASEMPPTTNCWVPCIRCNLPNLCAFTPGGRRCEVGTAAWSEPGEANG